jgi:hypothetical protein
MEATSTDRASRRKAFCTGDEVVLAEGTYQGTPGVFLGLRADDAWADVRERDGRTRSHPMAWLASGAHPSPEPARGAGAA